MSISARSGRTVTVGLPCAFYIGLTVLMTWPAVLHLRDEVPGWIGDNLYFVWLIAWIRDSLLSLHSPWWVPYVNYPEGASLACSQITPLQMLLAMPFAVAATPAFGYNVCMLLSFVLSAGAVHYWTWRLTRSTGAGLIAGTIFAFSPYRISHLMGHLDLLGTQWIPLFFMCFAAMLDRVREGQSGLAYGSALLASLFAACLALTHLYYFYMSVLLAGILALGYALFADNGLLGRKDFWKASGVFCVVAIPVALLAALPYLRAARGAGGALRNLADVRQYCASPEDYLLPSPQHFLWGSWIRSRFERKIGFIENTIYLGLVPCSLAALALARRRRISPEGSAAAKLFLWTAGFAFVLSLGTDLHFRTRPVPVPMPGAIARWFGAPDSAFFPLPGYLLYRYLPFYAAMRVWMRYGLYVNLFAAMLAGLGANWILERMKRRFGAMVSAAILALIVFEFLPAAHPLTQAKMRPVDEWLAGQPGHGAIAELPFGEMGKPGQMLYAMMRKKPLIGGYFSLRPPQHRRIAPILARFPDEESVRLLRQLGAEYLVTNPAKLPDFAGVSAKMEALGFRQKAAVGGYLVYRADR